jgi:activator of HSP90 ATPase
MPESLEMSETFSASPLRIYTAWLEGAAHAAMTGSPAESDPEPGGAFTAWDGYISGRHVVLEHGRRIVQTWRTGDFPGDAPDSNLEIVFEELGRGAKLTLKHTLIPDGQAEEYRQGWLDYYFKPMKRYFAGKKKK